MTTSPLNSSAIDPRPVRDWRCRVCGGLLGRVRGRRLHIKVRRCNEYVTTLPCTATCRTCSALNGVGVD